MPATLVYRRANTAFRLLVASLVLAPLYTVARANPLASEPSEESAPSLALVRDGELPQPVQDVDGVEHRLFLDGRVYVSGQPSAEALAALASRGVTAVVNLRTEEEMADRTAVPVEEAATADRLHLAYVEAPIGGDDHPYRPEVLEALHQVLTTHPGRVLLHCRSGHRAAYVWTAYLVRFGGLSLDEALAHGRAIAIPPDPLALLLDRPLELELGDAAPSP